jgi:Flp pilus assembly protein protease CpaA
MLELLAFFVALAGTIIASYYDLRTTEVPDLLPIFMIASGILINALNFFLTKDPKNFFLSLINGTLFSAVGFSMYFAGQWGGGDAFLLAAIGFLIPRNLFIKNDFPFFFTYLINLFFLGSIYMIIYSIFFALKSKKAIRIFKGQIKKFSLPLCMLFFLFLLISSALSYLVFASMNIKIVLLTSTISFFLVILWLFSKSIEKLFIRKIPISKLKVGDVLLESKRWNGITEKKLEEIKKSGRKYVYVKSGICFAPAFPIALVFTMLCGNSIVMLLNLLSLI